MLTFTLSLILSMLLGSSAKWQWQFITMQEEKPLESRLDNPKYFEGDLDISQVEIDAYYEQQSGKNVRVLLFFCNAYSQF